MCFPVTIEGEALATTSIEHTGTQKNYWVISNILLSQLLLKHITNSPFYLYDDKVWVVNANKKYGLRTDILRGLLGQLGAMLHHHRKVFVYRFDLHVPSYTDSNKLITDFNRQLFKRIKSHYKVKRIGYGWAREKETSKQQHYHYVLMLDGSKVQTPHTIQA